MTPAGPTALEVALFPEHFGPWADLLGTIPSPLTPPSPLAADPSPPIQQIAPPIPAPYLPGAKALSDELLDACSGHKSILPPLDDVLQAHIYTAGAEIQFRRDRYERRHNVKIVEERNPF